MQRVLVLEDLYVYIDKDRERQERQRQEWILCNIYQLNNGWDNQNRKENGSKVPLQFLCIVLHIDQV